MSLLALVRAATAADHADLETEIAIESVVADCDRYRALLEGFLGYYEPLEARLAATPGWAALGIDFAAREKSPWLRADLRALGLSPVGVNALPRADAEVPAVPRFGHALGCAYVLEGATLGGRVISGLLAKGPIPAAAREFFTSYGARVPDRWREFCHAFESFAGHDDDAVIDGAVGTFRGMRRWLTQSGVPA